MPLPGVSIAAVDGVVGGFIIELPYIFPTGPDIACIRVHRGELEAFGCDHDATVDIPRDFGVSRIVGGVPTPRGWLRFDVTMTATGPLGLEQVPGA